MEACLVRPYDYQGRICDGEKLVREVRLDDPSLTTLPLEQSKALILDIRGTSIVELPPGTQFLHLRTDYFVWSPKIRTLMIEVHLPQTVIVSLLGKRVGELIEHPLLRQLGVDRRYVKEVSQISGFITCSLLKRRPR